MVGKGKKANGRPSKFTNALAEQILFRISNGEAARAICRDEGMPHWSTLCRWKAKNAAFRDQYVACKAECLEAWADDIDQIAGDESRDYTMRITESLDKEGNVTRRIEEKVSDNTAVNRDRLKVDTKKWIMSKLAPKVYGDLTKHEHTGIDGGPIKYEKVVDKPPKETPEQWQARVAKQIEDKAKAQPH